MKKIIRLLTLALLTVPVTTFAQSEGNQNTSEPAGKVVASKPDSLLDWETPHDPTCPQVLLETTMGNILVALYNDTPKHRDNFLKLVNSSYYDGCIFYYSCCNGRFHRSRRLWMDSYGSMEGISTSSNIWNTCNGSSSCFW